MMICLDILFPMNHGHINVIISDCEKVGWIIWIVFYWFFIWFQGSLVQNRLVTITPIKECTHAFCIRRNWNILEVWAFIRIYSGATLINRQAGIIFNINFPIDSWIGIICSSISGIDPKLIIGSLDKHSGVSSDKILSSALSDISPSYGSQFITFIC